MDQGKSLLKNTVIYAIGELGSKVLAFLLLPLYSFYLSAPEFGTYDLIIASVTLLIPFITIQSSDSIYRWLLDAKAERKSITITTGFFIIIIVSLVFCAIYYISYIFIDYKYGNYIFFLLLFSAYLPCFQQILRGLGKNKLYATAGIFNTIILFSLNILLLVVFKLGLKSLFIASITANILTIIFICIVTKLGRFISIKNINLQEAKKMIAYSWPLIPNSISWWLINIADKYLILYILNIEANGLYAVSSRFPAIITVFNSIFLMAWQDHGIIADNEDNQVFFSKTLDKFINFEFTLVILLISISQFVIKHFISYKFFEAYKYMPMLYIGVAYAALSAYLGVGYQRAKATKDIFKTTMIGGVINICTSIFLMRYIGLYAPALGTFLSFSTIYLIRKHQTNQFFSIKVNNKKLILLTCIALIYPIQYYLSNVFQLLFFTCALMLFAVLNKDLFAYFLTMLKERRVVKVNSL